MITKIKPSSTLTDSGGNHVNMDYVHTQGLTTFTTSETENLIDVVINEEKGTVEMIYEIISNGILSYSITNNMGQAQLLPSKKFKKKTYKSKANKLVFLKEVYGANNPNKVFFEDNTEYAGKGKNN